jgi:TonB-dependent receptor
MKPQTSTLRAALTVALLLSLCLPRSVTAATSNPASATRTEQGAIEGRVQNGSTGDFLKNAWVRLESGKGAVATDEAGHFRITGIPAGTFQVTASYVGLDSQTKAITVGPNQVQRVEFELRSSEIVEMDKFVVLNRREENAQALAMNQQRQSPNIKNVVAFDEYPQGSDNNISDFIQYIPGVSINYSGRSGIAASVRGLPPEMSTVTIDGADVASMFGGNSRQTSLLTVPTTNVSTVEVTKVPTPDMPANGLGSNINITTRSGFERATPLLKYEFTTAFDPQYGFKLSDRIGPHSSMTGPTIRPSFDLNYQYPVNKSLTITLAASNRLNYYGQENATLPNWDRVAGFQTSVQTLRLAQLVNVRTATLGVDWKLGETNIFKANLSFRERLADQGNHGLQATYGAGATGNDSFTQGAATAVGTMAQTNSWQKIGNNTVHSSFKFTHLGDVWKIEGLTSYSVARFKYVPGDQAGYFGSTSITIPNLVLRGEGRSGPGDRAADLAPAVVTARDRSGNLVSIYDGNLYSINSATVDNQGSLTHKAQFRMDIGRDLPTSFPLRLKTGGATVLEYQKIYTRTLSYNFRPTASVADRQARNYDLINTEYSNSQDPLLGGQVQWVGPARLFDLFRARPDYFVLNETNAYQTNVLNSKKFTETISAGYVRLESRLLKNRLWLVGGVRYERTDDEGFGPQVDPNAQYRKNSDGSLARDASGRRIPITTDPLAVARLVYKERGSSAKTDYDGLYPSLNSSFELRNDLVLRFGYARTIGRPNLPSIIPGVTYSTITETSTQQDITVINSRLRPWTANNFDLSMESYLIKDGFGSIGAFQKNLRNFFTSTAIPGTPENLAQYGVIASAGDALQYNIITRGNGGDARVRGLEFSYRQSFGFIGKWGKSLQAFLNHTRSSLSGSATADFTGFNPRSLSWGLTWSRPRYVIKYSSNLQDEVQRTAVAASATVPPGTYNYQAKLRRDTVSFEFAVRSRVRVFASVQDLNTPGGYHFKLLQYAPGTPKYMRPTRIIEWGVSAIFGVKGEF